MKASFHVYFILRASLIHVFKTTYKQKDITEIYIFISTPHYNLQGVSEKTEQIWNCSQRREAAQSMKVLINIDCLGTYDVE